ncbi:MAG TPA: hypothetical protein VFS00_02670 [Polyangiaceae bacterium]|nr:hypothetical protein [Polyangiaceae bacterium]
MALVAVAVAVAVAVGLAATDARAESIELNAALPGVEVRSGRLSLERDRLMLEGDAVVRVGPARISGARITFRRLESGGLRIEGPFTIGPCPCPDPPLALRVRRAELGPGLRAQLHGSALTVFGVPLVPVPWVALRGPDTVGLLPPRVQWRAEDGLLVGAGAFVPFARGAWARLQPALYVDGGSDLRLHVQTPTSSLRLRRDERRSSFYAVDARGYAPVGEGTLAWEADVDRGARARRALTELDEAARAYDRVAAGVLWPGERLSASAGLRGTLRRGLGPWFLGPRLGAAWREGGGPWVAGLTADASTLGRSGEAAHLGRLDADLGAYGWAGPARLGHESRSGANGWLWPDREGFEAFSGAEASAGLPFARPYGGGNVHVIEPGVSALGVVAVARGRLDDAFGRPLLPAGGAAGLPSAFVEQRLGGGRWALASRVAGGLVASSREGPAWALRAGAAFGLTWLQGRWDGALVLGRERPAGVSVGRVDLGDARGAGVGARWAMRGEIEPVAARALGPWRSALASGGWLSAPGATVGAEARVPLPGAWLLTVGADVDATEPELERLGERAGLTHRHACGCLVFGASAGRRAGRDGVDAQIALDIVTPYDGPR